MSEYTAQEWQRDGTTVYALNLEGSNRFIALVQGGWETDGRVRTSIAELRGNARLIAAAPELLEACEMAVQTFIVSCRPAGNPDVDDAAEIRGMVATLRAAVAKATGVQP